MINQIVDRMIAIEPPEYFPGLPYAALLATVNRCEIDSRFQYSRQSFQNRARLRTPDGYQWISIPLTNGQYGQSICDIRIDYDQNWVSHHLKALRFNYGSTPYYDHFIPDIEELLNRRPATLGALTTESVRLIYRFLDCQGELQIISPHHTSDRTSVSEGGVQRVHLEERGGLREPHSSSAQEASLKLRINTFLYRQNFEGFESDMSVLDLLFNFGPASRGMLERSVITERA